MRGKKNIFWLAVVLLFCSLFGQAQQTATVNSATIVPPLVNFSGVLNGGNGKPLTNITGVTFSLYAEQEGESPLWLETQNVQPDKNGNYTAQLGSTTSQGLPASLFASGRARWLGVQAQGQEPQPRVMLLSVPYALKAGDAQTLGGRPAAAFVTASGNNSAGPNSIGNNALSGSGTTDYVPLWLSKSKLGSSKIFQSTAGDLGIGTTSPAATLDVNGTVNAAISFNIGETPFAFGSYANQNAFLGFAGNTTTTGVSNTANGMYALASNTTGNSNTASGEGALASNTTASGNTAVGYVALYSNTTGSGNDALGYEALYSNTTASDNTAVGYYALADNTTGSPNDAFGYAALNFNTTGGANDAFGNRALFSNTTGDDNTATGVEALYSNNAGYDNTASGLQALYSNTTGYENTAVGWGALGSNITGSDLTCIGYSCTASRDGLTNATAIGAHAVVGQSNSLVLGGTGKYAVNVGIGTTTPSNILTIGRGAGHPVSDGWETFSSRRWKTNIQPLANALAKVGQLRGVSYDLKDSGKIGVIAEEVGEIVPEVVSYEDNGKDARGVDYSRLTALLIEATKEQQALIHRQRQQIRKQQAQLKAQETRIDEQQAQIRSSVKLAQTQQAQIAELMSQVKAIDASLKTSGRTGTEVRTVKAQTAMVQQ